MGISAGSLVPASAVLRLHACTFVTAFGRNNALFPCNVLHHRGPMDTAAALNQTRLQSRLKTLSALSLGLDPKGEAERPATAAGFFQEGALFISV